MHHSHAAILSIGDELLRGQTLDTNSQWLSQRLLDRGIQTVEHVTIPDDQPINARTLRRLAELAPLVISTGGLGPTDDDLARDALADTLAQSLIIDDDALHHLEALFAKRARPLTDLQRRQALRPSGARCLPNALGTAPGLHARLDVAAPHLHSDLFLLPGPPGELRPMFDALVVPALRPEPGVVVLTRVLHMIGIGEGDAAKRAGDLMRRDRNPLVGITATGAVVSWRLLARVRGSHADAHALLDADEHRLRELMGPHIFARDDRSLPDAMLHSLRARARTLATVESCTGGMLAQMLTDVPGSSDVFLGGLVTYSNTLKTRLAHVPAHTLESFGAVSAPTARAMALGGRQQLACDHCLAITGIAGPAGATPDKPVGTVWIAHAAPDAVDVRSFLIPGSRHDVRERAARSALGMLHFHLAMPPGATMPQMLFEVSRE